MNREEIVKLLNFILYNSELTDQDIIELIYILFEKIENDCSGYKDDYMKQRFVRLYQEIFYGIYEDLIASYDWLDKTINNALSVRNKQIVDKEK